MGLDLKCAEQDVEGADGGLRRGGVGIGPLSRKPGDEAWREAQATDADMKRLLSTSLE